MRLGLRKLQKAATLLSKFLIEIKDHISETTLFVLFCFSCEKTWSYHMSEACLPTDHLTSGFTFRRWGQEFNPPSWIASCILSR